MDILKLINYWLKSTYIFKKGEKGDLWDESKITDKEYCDKLLSVDGQETLEHSHSYSFYVGDEKHTVDVYLY